jgi:hypothetical protein
MSDVFKIQKHGIYNPVAFCVYEGFRTFQDQRELGTFTLLAKTSTMDKYFYIFGVGVYRQTPWPLVRKLTIPTERLPLVGEI